VIATYTVLLSGSISLLGRRISDLEQIDKGGPGASALLPRAT